MTFEKLVLLVFGIHLLVLFLYLLIRSLLQSGEIRKEMLPALILLPGAGLLIVGAIDYLYATQRVGVRELDMEEMHLSGDFYWQPIKQSSEEKHIVPLEEAITLNDHTIRRKLLLDTLFEDPKKYLDVLLIARENSDVEITHYATTTISKIRSDYQRRLKTLTTQVTDLKLAPNELLNSLIKELEEFIHSGLLEDSLLVVQRHKLDEYLSEKLSRDPFNEKTVYQKVENDLMLEEYTKPKTLIMDLISVKPFDENVWLNAMEYCLKANDPVFFQFIISKLNDQVTNIKWTRAGYEKASPWITSNFSRYPNVARIKVES